MNVWLLALAVLCCSEFGPRIEGWPKLNVIVIYVNSAEKFCTRAVTKPLVGCAEVDFDKRLCTAIVEGLPGNETEQHERKHCAGHDHRGESTLRDQFLIWKFWKSENEYRGRKIN